MLILLLLAIETAGLSADQGTQASKAAEVLQDAKVLIQTGQVLRARQLAEQVRNQDFPDASIQNELGKVFESAGDLPQAQAAYRRSVALDPLTEDYWLDLVSLLLLLDQPHEALSLLRGAIGRLPNSYPLRLALGTALEASGEKNEALHIFEQATQKDPDRAPAYVLYGKLASLMGKTEAAVRALRKAVQIDRTDARARYHLGLAQRKAGRPNRECLEEFRKAIEIDPHYSLARFELAKGLERENRLSEAVAEYQRTLKDDPSLMQAHYRLYESYKKLGLEEKAQEELKAFRTSQEPTKIRPM